MTWHPPEMTGAECQCTTCGKRGQDYYVQPQPDGSYRCGDCHNRAVEQWHTERKAELDAMPHCSCCKRRGTWKVSGVYLCGHHKNAVERNRARDTAGWGILGLLGAGPVSHEEILRLARGELAADQQQTDTLFTDKEVTR